jgi:formylglycine-generating enzyme required for sulfatase activity
MPRLRAGALLPLLLAPAPAAGGRVDHPMVRVAPGRFTMGSPPDEAGRDEDEAQHAVTLTRGFWMGQTEVTQRLWRSVMGTRPSKFRGDARPVEQVSWCDAVAFANRLSAREGLPVAYQGVEGCEATAGASVAWDRASVGYRLPTEAEWEYAARAGGASVYAGGDDLGAVGWTEGDARGATRPVGQKAPNAWGLHDMTGNVWEWCWDVYGPTSGASTDPVGALDGPRRVDRGGSWLFDARNARVAVRDRNTPDRRSGDIGVRLVRTIP